MNSKTKKVQIRSFLPYLLLLACMFTANLLLAAKPEITTSSQQEQRAELQIEAKESHYNISLFQFISLPKSRYRKRDAAVQFPVNKEDSLQLPQLRQKH